MLKTVSITLQSNGIFAAIAERHPPFDKDEVYVASYRTGWARSVM